MQTTHTLLARPVRWLLACALLGLALASHGRGVRSAPAFATIIVDTTADDNIDNGNCTLREAILSANTNTPEDACAMGTAGLDMIVFSLFAPATINVQSALPALTEPVVIDGQLSGGRLELNGLNAGPNVNGLQIQGGTSTIRNLVVNRFSLQGIVLSSNGNTVQNCILGADPTGTLDRGNTLGGVFVSGANNLIGGLVSNQGNLISGNDEAGVHLTSAAATNNQVQGNLIGTNLAGTGALGNGNGVFVDGGANGNTIGGTALGARNVISGNTANGLLFFSGANNNTVQGNFIGTNAAGTAALGNLVNGVRLGGVMNNVIGGTAAGARNVISSNGQDGVNFFNSGAGTTNNLVQGNFIGTNATGTAALGNILDGVSISDVPNNTIGGMTAAERNVISGNGRHGVLIGGAANGNKVSGNYIGTDANGTADLGNSFAGVAINGAPNVTVGGTTVAERNVISGNDGFGVFILGPTASGNKVSGNFIGTDVNGTADLGNSFSGVVIDSAPNNTIGGTTVAERNVISGNNANGVFILVATASGNLVLGNYIGTNAAGTAALANTLHGVRLDNVPNNFIGGTAAGARNLISGNGGAGVVIVNGGASGNSVQGNFIGTNPAGTAALPNAGGGVLVGGAPNNTIGGTVAGAGNLISGNGFLGIGIVATGANGNLVQGNFVGTDSTGTSALGNTQTGIYVGDASVIAIAGVPNVGFATTTTIGGTLAGARNLASGNGNIGIEIQGSGATGNTVQGNFAGTNAAGTGAIPNTAAGVRVAGAPNNLIGGAGAGARNLISGNTGNGVRLDGAAATNNQVQGNFIGTTATGLAALANGGNGVNFVNGASGNTVGGTAAGAGNLISGNALPGVFFNANCNNNTVQGNFIGTNVNGTAALPNGARGLTIENASGNLIGGTAAGARNVISGNNGQGLQIRNGAANNNVQGNFIGTNVNGTAALPNTTHGVEILNAPTNTIGGTAAGARNLLAGNGENGVFISGATATGNQVQGNFIGTNAAGTAALGNGMHGVRLDSALTNTIGGTAAAARNLISGNTGAGVVLFNGANGNLLQGNFIGANAAGTGALGNSRGVIVENAAANVIGGTAAGAGNVISGNTLDGLALTNGAANNNTVQGNFIGANVSGTGALGNGQMGVRITSGTNNIIGGTAAGARNIISGNGVNGVDLFGVAAANNQVLGNFIGTDVTGATALGNVSHGIKVTIAPNNTIGGTAAGSGNVISGNGQTGLWLEGNSTTGTQVQGNLIGVNAAGTAALPNNDSGIFVFGAPGNTIGGTAAGGRNVISGNATNGVFIAGALSSGNQVQGNFIGTNAAGTAALGNGQRGISLVNSPNNTIGGAAAGAGNVVSGNGDDGIAVESLAANAANGNTIQGNFVGTNAAGLAALPNADNGIAILSTGNCLVGGTAAGAGNLISGNGDDGLEFSGLLAGGNNVAQGNRIGVSAGGGALGNAVDGVHIFDNAAGNTVGGTVAGAANLIANNGNNGVTLDSPTALNNALLGNAIFGNLQLGIDLTGDGVTPNDAGDPDAGANRQQNFPVLNFVSSAGVVNGALDSLPANTAYPVRIEFFGNTACDASGNGEGETLLGFVSVAAPGAFTATVTLAPGKNFITATATDANGNTSEFSVCRALNAAPTITATANTRQQGSPATNSQIATVADADQAANTLTVQVNNAASATVNGVTVSNLTINAAGVVNADIVAACTASAATFTLKVTDAANDMATTTLNVAVTPNTPPVLSYAASQNVLVGGALNVTPTAANDNGAINTFTVVSVVPPLATPPTVNAAGVVTITNASPVGAHLITIQATDNCGFNTTAAFTLNVNCPVITVNPTTLPNGTAGTAYAQTISATPATTYNFTVSAGSLPPGLSLNAANGNLSGTPTQAGTFNFTVTATGFGTCTGAQAYTLVIGCPVITVNPTTLPNGTAGTAYAQTISATPATTYNFTVSAGSLPPGLALNAATGDLTGTPTQAGTFNFTVTATGFGTCTGTRAYTLLIGCPVITVNPTTLPNGTAGTAYAQTISATPVTTYNFTVSAGSLPPGLSLTAATGNLSGTPTQAGTFNFTVTATGFGTCTGTQAYTLVISCPTITVNPTTLPSGTAGTAYAQTISATPATTYNFTISAGSLPPGLTLNAASGNLSGTPTQAGTFNFTVTAAGFGTCTGTRAYTLTIVCPVITVNPATLPNAATNIAYAQTLTAAGGTAPFSFAVTSGALPTGLTLAANGNLSGTPTTAGPFNFTVTATDANNCTGNRAYTLTVAQTGVDLTSAATGTPAAAAPDGSVTYTLTVRNNGPDAAANVRVTNTLPTIFRAEALTPSVGTCAGLNTGTVTCNLGTLASGATATVTIRAHVPALCQPASGTNTVTVTSDTPELVPANNTATVATTVNLPNTGAGGCINPVTQQASGDKPGSILFFGLFASGATGGSDGDNTSVSLTNTHPTQRAFVHLFFIDGSTCAVADAFVCLTPQQTTRFSMSDIDPGVAGYMMTVVTNELGCPISFNHLIGAASVKITNSASVGNTRLIAKARLEAEVNAEAVPAEFGSPVPGCDANSTTATLRFNGQPDGYQMLPRVVALSNIPSTVDDNVTLLQLARVGGNLSTNSAPLGNVFGILYDDAEKPYSFSFNSSQCLFRRIISNDFPRTAPRFESIVPAGRSGWMKFWTEDDAALVGSVITGNPNIRTSANAFSGGHQLHVLRLTAAAVITVPVFPPSC